MMGIYEEDMEEIISGMAYEECEGRTFLITGANGFLAGYMVDTLMFLKKNRYVKKCSIFALCRDKQKAERKFKEWLDDNDFVILSQAVEQSINIEEKVDYIIHAASCSQTFVFGSKPVEMLQSNVIGTYNMLELARKKKIKGFLFFSSGAVYGDTDEAELFEEKTYEIDYLDMNQSYACGKRMGECLCKAYWQQYQIPTKCVRISHTYGPGIDINDGHVYSDFAKNILNHRDLVIRGDGKDTRPFCYVTDAIRAFWMILFNGRSGEIYNMANSNEIYSVKELADILVQQIFPERGINTVVMVQNSTRDVIKKRVNTQKLQMLGWNPKVGISEGFKRLIVSLEEDYEVET